MTCPGCSRRALHLFVQAFVGDIRSQKRIPQTAVRRIATSSSLLHQPSIPRQQLSPNSLYPGADDFYIPFDAADSVKKPTQPDGEVHSTYSAPPPHPVSSGRDVDPVRAEVGARRCFDEPGIRLVPQELSSHDRSSLQETPDAAARGALALGMNKPAHTLKPHVQAERATRRKVKRVNEPSVPLGAKSADVRTHGQSEPQTVRRAAITRGREKIDHGKVKTQRHARGSMEAKHPSGSKSSKAESKAARKNMKPWQIQKQALKVKFGTQQWEPKKKLSPDAMEGIRAMNQQFPDHFTTPVLAAHFKVSAEAVRRILKSKWKPTEDEEIERRNRWDKRGEKIWTDLVAKGVHPPKRWREMGIGTGPRYPSQIRRQEVRDMKKKLLQESQSGSEWINSLSERIA